MTPKEYYYKQFRKDFQKFWGIVPHRNNYVTGEPLFKFAGLVKSSNLDSLKHIPKENLSYFLSALGCTILIDQVMYTHFKKDYDVFQRITLYPKMTIAWSNANPWIVFHQNVRLPRGIYKHQALKQFSEFANFFIKDFKKIFSSHDFNEATWENVKKVMLEDSDVNTGEFGQTFLELLKRN